MASVLNQPISMPPGLYGNVFIHKRQPRLHPRHRHDPIELNLGVQGTAVNDIGARRYPIGPGTLTWLFPGQDHQLVDQSPDFTMWIILVEPQALARWCGRDLAFLCASDPPGHHSRRLADDDARDLIGFIRALCGMLGDPAAANPGLACLLRTCFAMYRRAPELPDSGGVHPAVSQAAQLLAADPGLGGEALARRVGLSRTRLSRIFHQQMGETIQARRERLRISAFVTRRQASHGSLLTDALDAGFGSYAQFHRAFRRVMGVTPRSWLGNQRHYGG